jgi:pyruvate,water dikinase
MESKNIIWLKDVDKNHLEVVGGKGANLGEMFKNFEIPNGFCITVDAYDKFLDHNKLKDLIVKELEGIDVENTTELEKRAKNIRKAIEKSLIPKELITEKKEHYNKLKNKKVAVRSSATAEDLPNASFAGQHDTYLNILGHDDFVDSVKKCWASLFTSRAIYYRDKNGFKHEDVKISVVVQEMVEAKYAGVMFTIDPIFKKHILVEAVKGLGEKLVSGEVTPNTYFLDKKTFEVGQKNIMFDMDVEIIKKVAKEGEKVEAHYKQPMDVEWVINENDELKIVQARPITTL